MMAVSHFILFAILSVIPVPPLTGPVEDQGALLKPAEIAELSTKIKSYQPQVQMQILTIDSLEDEAIEAYSIRVVDEWKLGDAKADNGLLILVSRKDRAVRIEVGQGLEGQITDVLAGRIIDHLIVPHFKRGDFAGGLSAAIDELAFRLELKSEGAKVPAVGNSSQRSLPFILVLIYLALMFLFYIGRLLGIVRPGRRSQWQSGGFSGWGGGGFGGGGFGGGSWSGGGGGFSGGGGSGRW